MNKAWLLSFSLLMVMTAKSQDPCFELLGSYNIQCAAEEGNILWLGTEEQGLLAFNKAEQTFEEYNPDNSNLSEYRVRSLLLYQNDLLISTDSSLYFFDNGDFETYNDSLAGELLFHDGRLLVGGNLNYYELESDVVVYEKDLGEEVVFSCGFCEQTTDMIIDSQGDVWLTHFGFYEFDILQFDGVEWTLHDHSTVSTDIFPIESWNPNNRLCSFEDQVLATSWAGLKTFENNGWELAHTFTAPTIIEGSDTLLTPTAIAADQNTGFWVGAMQNWQSSLSGKVAYHNGVDWQVFQPDLPDSTKFNRFYPSSDPQIIYAATSLGLVIIDKSCLDLSVTTEPAAEETFVYPNPAKDVLRFSERFSGKARVFDLQGKLMLQVSLIDRQSLDISALPIGMYLLQLDSGTNLTNLPLVLE
jgi:hypothetical protein